MFTACPHCQFLVARDPRADASPVDCPRCGRSLATDSQAQANASPSLATFLTVGTAGVEAAPGDPAREVQDDAVGMPMPTVEEVHASEAPADGIDTPATDDPTVIATSSAVDAPAHDATAAAQDAVSDTVQQDARSTTTPDITPASTRKTTAPRFLQRAHTPPPHARRIRGQWAAMIALSLLLCMQVVLADRARLAAQAGWRPLVLALCGAFRCDVPTWREPAAFTMLSRDVRPITGQPGTLQAQATFRNEARWAQAWPVILLTLKDADGHTLGARALQPRDYLAEGEAAVPIGPGQSAQMAVRVREPSANVVAFSFDFR